MLKKVNCIKWTVIILFTTSLIIEYFWIVISLKYSLKDDTYENWSKNTYLYTNVTTAIIYILINLINTFVTILAIIKLSNSVRVLQKANPKLKFNYLNMVIHSVLLSI